MRRRGRYEPRGRRWGGTRKGVWGIRMIMECTSLCPLPQEDECWQHLTLSSPHLLIIFPSGWRLGTEEYH